MHILYKLGRINVTDILKQYVGQQIIMLNGSPYDQEP